MAVYHLSVKTFSRSNGQSAVAAAAYRACQKLVNVITGEVADFTRKSGLFLAKIFVPPGAPEPTRQDLWNLAESSENRKNSTLAREWELALPGELSDTQRADLAESFCAELVSRYQVAVDLCIHRPGRGGREDDRNHHAHILTTTRVMMQDGSLGAKTRQLDDLKTGEIKVMRERWAELCNQALERAGHTARVSHLSHRAQGFKELPTVKQGNGPSAARRKAKNAEIRQVNADLRAALKERGQARAAELARRFIQPVPPPPRKPTMTPQLIKDKIDSLLSQPGTTLDTLRVQLRPLGVTLLEDRGDDFYWELDHKCLPENAVYTRGDLLARGLLLEEPKKALGFATQEETHKPGQEDDDLAQALRALLDLSKLLSAGAQNLLIQFLNFVLKMLGVDYQIEKRHAQVSQPAQPEIMGTGHGPSEGRTQALAGVAELTKKVQMVVKPDLDKARLARASAERSQLLKEERAELALSLMAKTPQEKRDAERKHKELMARRARLDIEIEEMKMQLEPKNSRENWLNKDLFVMAENLQEKEKPQFERER